MQRRLYLMKLILRPTVMYGSECFTLELKHQRKIESMWCSMTMSINYLNFNRLSNMNLPLYQIQIEKRRAYYQWLQLNPDHSLAGFWAYKHFSWAGHVARQDTPLVSAIAYKPLHWGRIQRARSRHEREFLPTNRRHTVWDTYVDTSAYAAHNQWWMNVAQDRSVWQRLRDQFVERTLSLHKHVRTTIHYNLADFPM